MELEINLVDMLQESFTLVILLGFSVILVTFGMERWLFYRKIKRRIYILCAVIFLHNP